MYDLIVIGAGPGGYEAAAHAGKMGKKVAVVEKQHIGGTCLNVGCIPTKAFLRSSRFYSECRHAADYGIRIGEPQFDMTAVLARKNRIVGTLTRGVDGLLKRAGVEVIRGHGRLAGRDAVRVGDTTYSARNILIATGSRPAAPPIAGIESPGILDSTSALDLSEIPSSIAIIGGSYIGLEFACFFGSVGSKVTVLEMLPQIAGSVDEEIAKRLHQALTKMGAEIKTSCQVMAIDGSMVHYTGGSLSAERVLNATGRVPVTDGLGLEETGVDFDRRGIRTSERGKTNIPGVWACGDVTGRLQLAHAATREGLVAVNNMFGAADRIRYEAIPAVIYTHPEVACVGKTERELKEQGIEYRSSKVPMAVSGRFLIEHEGASGFVKVLAGARYGEILGVHAIGDGASEFIAAAAAMIETEMSVSDVDRIVFPHPTISEALKQAVLEIKL